MRIEGDWETRRVLVDSRELSPERSQKLFNHSPDGFAWGYGGSGPAQLALAILLAAGVDARTAVQLHQQFKWEFIAPLPPRESFVLDLDVAGWADAMRQGWRTA